MKLLLVDALNLIYRSFYAIRDLSTAAGQPTNALFGFIKTLQQLDKGWRPTHRLVVFDGAQAKERRSIFEGYKAQRPPMPEPLRRQLPLIEEFLNQADIQHVRLPEKEADDVIASLAARVETESTRPSKLGTSGEPACRELVDSVEPTDVLIASSDKDLFQVVSERVLLLPSSKPEEQMGRAEVAAKTGVQTTQIVDWLALTGDAVDNIPGVPGVGAKTAARWLNEFGSLEGVWTNLEAVMPEKLREALRSHKAEVERNVRLIRLDRTVSLPLEWESLRSRPPDPARLIPFFETMEFHSLIRPLQQPELL
ncbi:MAG: hypothetical protein HY343_01115 [Lentisphaerae bacterium]|nr:hypothetical protein [Lentisphaerota bacterium]